MKTEDINNAIGEAQRFIERATWLLESRAADEARVNAELAADPAAYTYAHSFPKENGAVRRASMDLTRALAKMRGAACAVRTRSLLSRSGLPLWTAHKN